MAERNPNILHDLVAEIQIAAASPWAQRNRWEALARAAQRILTGDTMDFVSVNLRTLREYRKEVEGEEAERIDEMLKSFDDVLKLDRETVDGEHPSNSFTHIIMGEMMLVAEDGRDDDWESLARAALRADASHSIGINHYKMKQLEERMEKTQDRNEVTFLKLILIALAKDTAQNMRRLI